MPTSTSDDRSTGIYDDILLVDDPDITLLGLPTSLVAAAIDPAAADGTTVFIRADALAERLLPSLRTLAPIRRRAPRWPLLLRSTLIIDQPRVPMAPKTTTRDAVPQQPRSPRGLAWRPAGRSGSSIGESRGTCSY